MKGKYRLLSFLFLLLHRVQPQSENSHLSSFKAYTAFWCREFNLVLCDNLEGWEEGEKFQRKETYTYPWQMHVDVWQKPTQHCKAITPQLKINKRYSFLSIVKRIIAELEISFLAYLLLSCLPVFCFLFIFWEMLIIINHIYIIKVHPSFFILKFIIMRTSFPFFSNQRLHGI